MIFDLTSGENVSCRNYNGRSHAVTGDKTPERTPWERVAWALLELAVDDTKILCRYGLIKSNGDLRDWPLVKKKSKQGHSNNQWRIIASMRDPMTHARLREFWLDPTQAQLWCDLIGCKLPAKDIWNGILKHHAK